MNPNDPYHQPQSGGQPFGSPVPEPRPEQSQLAPSTPSADPLYDTAPAGASPSYGAPQPMMSSSASLSQSTQPGQPPMGATATPQQPAAPQGPAGVPGVAPSPYVLPPKPSKLWMVIAIVVMVIAAGLGGGFIWSMLQYIDQRDNVDAKVSVAVNEATKKQADKDAEDFIKREKQPNRLFVGPDDYGRVAFNYPKTWSAYVDQDALKGGTYAAYLNPVVVPPVKTSGQQFALRVLIEEKDYDKVVESYKDKVKKGDLKSSAVKADDQNGTRLDGMFTKDIKGSAVIFKNRDKTVTMQTDADVFKTDFDALIKTITFNK